MRLVATVPVRNEDWVIGLSLRSALLWCDMACVLNHASTDETASIIDAVAAEHPGRVHVIHEPDPTWAEMNHRQRLLEAARSQGATHIAIVDADEVLTANLTGTIRQHVEAMPKGAIMHLPGYNLRGGITKYHATGLWSNRWFAAIFADDSRLNWNGDRFHHREPMGTPLRSHRPIQQGTGGIMHLWGASERRLRAKHFAYQLTERMRWPAKPIAEIRRMYSLAVYGSQRDPAGSWKYTPVPPDWWAGYGDLMRHLDVDAVPWQEQWCRDAINETPRLAVGLDSFGVLDRQESASV